MQERDSIRYLQAKVELLTYSFYTVRGIKKDMVEAGSLKDFPFHQVFLRQELALWAYRTSKRGSNLPTPWLKGRKMKSQSMPLAPVSTLSFSLKAEEKDLEILLLPTKLNNQLPCRQSNITSFKEGVIKCHKTHSTGVFLARWYRDGDLERVF